MKRVNLAEARDRFSELVDEAANKRERIVLEARGRPKAALIGLEDLERLERGASGAPRSDVSPMLAWLEETQRLLRHRPVSRVSSASILRTIREERDAQLSGVPRRERRRKARRQRTR